MALRSFTARDGVIWNVWNVVPTLAHNTRKLTLGTGMSDGWLCFEGGGGKRRIFPVPHDWESWSDDELERALDEANAVQVRVRDTEPEPETASDARAS
ncbi:MAG TPA: hypothetical protein VEX86_22750 [Longimicrobium sp.]|nr:hypothetical protein [Longimicrobium sp.]